ncbi:hypothetical protein [Metarhizobium album]|uniref:hypothetical protein n=1 Tax=Metarhizobium album TaxID=2182425 RepID=UPI000FFE9E03|nr:hypothetical protein [Rhizobium album]
MSRETRWQQIESGFKAAGISVPTIQQLKLKLDTNQSRANDFYNKSIFALLRPTERENLARALTYLQYVNGMLAADTVEELFKTNKGKPDQELNQHIRQLAAPQPSAAAVPMREPLKPAVISEASPPRNPVIVMPELEAKLNKVIGAKSLVSRMAKENGDFLFKEISLLLIDFNKHLANNAEAVATMGRVSDEVHENFANAYRAIGKAGNARLALITKIAGSSVEMIPIIGKVISGPLTAALEKFHYDTEITSEFERRIKTQRDEVKANKGVAGLIATIEDRIADATTLGLSGDQLPTNFQLHDWLVLRMKQARTLAEQELKEALVKMFSFEGTQTSGFNARVVHNNMMSNMHATLAHQRGGPAPHLQQTFRDGMQRDVTQLREAMSNYFNRTVITDPLKLRPYIELTLWADYMKQKITPEKFNGSFREIQKLSIDIPDAMVTSLTALNVIRKKASGEKSAQVYQASTASAEGHANQKAYQANRIPYEGHPNHKIGVLLFLQWYDTINPFNMLCNTKFTPELLQQHMNSYISAIGTAIEASKVVHMIGHNTISDPSRIIAARDNQISQFNKAIA